MKPIIKKVINFNRSFSHKSNFALLKLFLSFLCLKLITISSDKANIFKRIFKTEEIKAE